MNTLRDRVWHRAAVGALRLSPRALSRANGFMYWANETRRVLWGIRNIL